jgi:hypothetical protein
MQFVVLNHGDNDVGISGFQIEVSMPNIGFDEVDWREQCESLLHELYSAEVKSEIYTKQDFNEAFNAEEPEEYEVPRVYQEYPY